MLYEGPPKKRKPRPDLAQRNRDNATHGMTISGTYFSWMQMRKRCANPKHVAFANYGGRGISVCEKWMKFENFLADMDVKPEKTELDRIDVNGNYEPSNCRWVSRTENCNNRRNNKRIEFNGKNLTYSEWSRETGLSKTDIRRRITNGWTAEETLITPPRKTKKSEDKKC